MLETLWYRLWDFYAERPLVYFRNSHPDAIIKQIKIIWYKESHLSGLEVELTPAQNFIDLFTKLCVPYFKVYPVGEQLTDTLISISDLQKLFALFEDINKKKMLVPPIIFTEIENIFYYIHKIKWNQDFDRLEKRFQEADAIDTLKQLETTERIKTELYTIFFFANKNKEKKAIYSKKHIMPLSTTFNTLPAGTYPFDLEFDYYEEKNNPTLKKHRESQQLKYTAKLYASGIDPNSVIKTHWGLTLPLLFAIRADRPELFRLMLAYGANPYKRIEDLLYESAYERVLRLKKEELRRSIDWVLNKPKATLAESKKPNIDMSLYKNAIVTHFYFSNNLVIHTEVASADYALPDYPEQLSIPLQKLYELFTRVFNKTAILPYLEFKTLFGKNKYLEWIYAGKELIGFNSFEICISKDQHHIILHCMYSALKKPYRGLGLGMLLGFRIGFCLPYLFPFKTAGIFFFSIHYNSFRPVEFFKPYPKHQSEINDEFMQKTVLPTVLKTEEKLQKDNRIARYVNDDTQVNDEKLNIDSQNPSEAFFYQFLLGLEKDSKEIRSCPVYFLANKTNLTKLSYMLTQMQIDFQQHLQRFTPYFSHFIHPFLSENKPLMEGCDARPRCRL